jgi:hypothetical protein
MLGIKPYYFALVDISMINTRNSLRRGNLDKNEPFQVGLTIAKLLTSSWNSQQKPPKIHFF